MERNKQKIANVFLLLQFFATVFFLPSYLSEKIRSLLLALHVGPWPAAIIAVILWIALVSIGCWLTFGENSPIQADKMRQGLLLDKKAAEEIVKRLWPVLGPDGRRWAADELTSDTKEEDETAIFKRGRKQGEAQGIAKGLAQGREEGYSLGHSEGYKYALYAQNRFRYYNGDPPLTYAEARRSLDEGTDGTNGELVEPPKKPRTRKKKAEPELTE